MRGAASWALAVTSLGAALVAVVALQVVLAVLAGFSLRQTAAGATGLAHRLGVPFGGLGGATTLLLLVGLVLQTLPALGGRGLTDRQQGLLRLSGPVAAGLAVILAVGGVLAVVSQLNEFTVRGVNAPAYTRLQLGTYLVGVVGIGAIVIAASAAARRLTQGPSA